jgi:hypothetical protein
VALALGRAKGAPLSSRYLDTFQIGIAVSIVSALSLMPAHLGLTSVRRGIPAAVALWFVLLAFWVGWDAYFHVQYPVEVRRQTAITETNNLPGYLSTGDFSYLTNKPIFEIPYPSAERLRGFSMTLRFGRFCRPVSLLTGHATASSNRSKWRSCSCRIFLSGWEHCCSWPRFALFVSVEYSLRRL